MSRGSSRDWSNHGEVLESARTIANNAEQDRTMLNSPEQCRTSPNKKGMGSKVLVVMAWGLSGVVGLRGCVIIFLFLLMVTTGVCDGISLNS